MITSQTAIEWIVKILSLFSYAITIPLVGYVRAWIAKKMGDDTPEQLGYLTLDPLTHYSLFWIGFIILIPDRIPFGFGQYIPLYRGNFRKPYRAIKLLAAYFSDALVSCMLALGALFVFMGLYGVKSDILLQSFMYVVVTRSYAIFASSFSSLSIIFSLWLANFVLFNVMLATFSFVLNIFYFGYFSFVERDGHRGQYTDWIMLIGPLFLLLLFSHYFYSAFLFGITWLANIFGSFFGVR